MDVSKYFLPLEANNHDLLPWSAILPKGARAFQTNLFADAFLEAPDGSIHILDRAACSANRIANSQSEFWEALEKDEEGWQLRQLADACRHQKMPLRRGQCYAFKTPIFAGGRYVPENVFPCRWIEWFDLCADLFQQTKNLPDGATIRIKLVR